MFHTNMDPLLEDPICSLLFDFDGYVALGDFLDTTSAAMVELVGYILVGHGRTCDVLDVVDDSVDLK
ncbi:unnamed protein product, partial [Ilex paraguariensis]